MTEGIATPSHNFPDTTPYKKAIGPKEREGFLKMVSMGVCANLYNGSPGRCPKVTAKQACDAAEALWAEWIKRP